MAARKPPIDPPENQSTGGISLSDLPKAVRDKLTAACQHYRELHAQVKGLERAKKEVLEHDIKPLADSLPTGRILNADGKPILRKQQRTTQEISAQRLLEAGVPMKTIQKCTEVKISEYWTVPSTGDDPTHD